MKKYFMLVLAASAVMILPVLLIQKTASKPASKIESFMEDVTVVSKKSGEHLWSMETKKADFSEDGKTANLSTVSLYIPKEGIKVDADSGTYDIESRELALKGDIRAVSEDFVIKTASISVNPDSEEISTDDRVVVESKGFRIEGSGLRAEAHRKVRLLKDVTAVFF